MVESGNAAMSGQLLASCRASGRRGRCAASRKLSPRCLSRRVVPPVGRRLCQAHLRERKRLGSVVSQGCSLSVVRLFEFRILSLIE